MKNSPAYLLLLLLLLSAGLSTAPPTLAFPAELFGYRQNQQKPGHPQNDQRGPGRGEPNIPFSEKEGT